MASANSTNQANDTPPPKPVSEITKTTTGAPALPTAAAVRTENGLPTPQNEQEDEALKELAPAFIPLDPSLIGVLPNGVHVSRMASYSQKVQAALRRVLPTATDAIKAYNLTAQLTLQYMMSLNNQSAQVQTQGRPLAPKFPSLVHQPAPSLAISSPTRVDQVKVSPATYVINPTGGNSSSKGPLVKMSTPKPATKETVVKPTHAKDALAQFVARRMANSSRENPPKTVPDPPGTPDAAIDLDDAKKLEEVLRSASALSTDLLQCARMIPFEHSKEKQLLKLKRLSDIPKRIVMNTGARPVQSAQSSKQNEKGKTSTVQKGSNQKQSTQKPKSTHSNPAPKQSKAKREKISSREMSITLVRKVKARSRKLALKTALANSKKQKDRMQKVRKRKQTLTPLLDTSSIEKAHHNPTGKSNPRRKRTNPEPKMNASPSKKPRLNSPTVSHDQGFVKRLASLNARACVSAMMEPDRKTQPKPVAKSSSSKPSRPTLSKPITTSLSSLVDNEAVLNRITKSGAGGQFVAIHHPTEEFVPVFNTQGLLYNGGTIHPTATRVFYSTKNNDLVLPKLIVPLLVPSKVNTIGSEIEQVHNFQPVTRKLPKSNNGWRTIGSPIKVVEYYQNDVTVTRKYYIGIQRKKDSVYVRDCVMLRSSPEEQPYIGKIASIWREHDGAIMMTLFWYYRPGEVDKTASAGMQFRENELLASQHYDVNSVACIEDKCYILGLKQYCRYHSRVKGRKHSPLKIIPHLPSRETGIAFVGQTVDEKKSRDKKAYFDLGPCTDEIIGYDPSLVYLCYRGYNHINGRIYQL